MVISEIRDLIINDVNLGERLGIAIHYGKASFDEGVEVIIVIKLNLKDTIVD